MGGQDAWVTRKQSSRDAMAMPGVREVRSRKTILRRDRRNAHTRAFPARTRGVVFSLATVWRHARPSSDPRPPDSRAPSSSFSSPTAAVGAEHGTSRGASREFRVSRSIAAPRAASPPHPRTPSATRTSSKTKIERARTPLRFPDGSLPDFRSPCSGKRWSSPSETRPPGRARCATSTGEAPSRCARYVHQAQARRPAPPSCEANTARKRSGCPNRIGKRRFAAAVVAARRGFFLERSAFWRAPSSPSKKKKLTTSSFPSPQPRPPLIRGSDVSGARSPTHPSSRVSPRVSSLRTDRDPPTRLSRNREDAARFATSFFFSLAFGRSSRRSLDPSKPIRRRAEEVTDDDFAP